MQDTATDTFYKHEVLQIFLRRSYIANPLVILDTYICAYSYTYMHTKNSYSLDTLTFKKRFVICKTQ